MQAEADAGQFVLPKHARRVLQLHPTQYRDAFLSILRGGDAIAATAAVRVLLALLLCRSVDNALLDAAGYNCPTLTDNLFGCRLQTWSPHLGMVIALLGSNRLCCVLHVHRPITSVD